MNSAGLEPEIPAIERSQIYALRVGGGNVALIQKQLNAETHRTHGKQI